MGNFGNELLTSEMQRNACDAQWKLGLEILVSFESFLQSLGFLKVALLKSQFVMALPSSGVNCSNAK